MKLTKENILNIDNEDVMNSIQNEGNYIVWGNDPAGYKLNLKFGFNNLPYLSREKAPKADLVEGEGSAENVEFYENTFRDGFEAVQFLSDHLSIIYEVCAPHLNRIGLEVPKGLFVLSKKPNSN